MSHPLLASWIGGLSIGISALALLLLLGRVAGVSGILAGLFVPRRGDTAWRASFVMGLILGGAGVGRHHPLTRTLRESEESAR